MRREDGGPANALIGFTDMLLRLWRAERPRAVLVGWDTLEVPTYRHEALEAYQSGRVFEDELLEQLHLLPSLVESAGFISGKAPGYEADDFLAAAADERGGRSWHRARRDLRSRCFPARERPRDDPPTGEGGTSPPASARQRCVTATASSPNRCPTSSRCGEIPPTASPAPEASARSEAPSCSHSTGRSTRCSTRDASRPRPTPSSSIAGSRRWIATLHFQRCRTSPPTGRQLPRTRRGSGVPQVARRFEEALTWT